ncbi:fructoselysine 6-kinase [Clostridium magnum]|uniref:Fructosamine kinase FrlD n=1 Tax=Clostridium magnum DSM 2767 TaxID=1121326 RepID=A0A162SAJ3_9CLOT|nr:fructoselysine 6-kinase [Clostridium magnum]KZL90983.1 fructosamine kinase FrlD [Clostridium magnum DSM 2767]SHI99101.1 Sugar or nucleoside kinase, ribokinase family [Clostridium magnum DSM 2767]
MIKVLGLGDNVVDKYEHIKTMYPGGNALNFAVFAKKIGIESAFLGAFGSDSAGKHVVNSIKELEVDISHCKFYEGENGCARVTLKDGDRVFLGSNRCGVLRTCGLNLTEEDYEYMKDFDLIHSGLYGFSEMELKKIKELGALVSYDFSEDYTEEKLNELLPILDYAFFSCSNLKIDDMLNLMLRAVNSGCKMALCTRGSEGAYLFDGIRFYRQEPNLVKAVDTMAAGDSFITCFIVNYLNKTKEENPDEETAINESLEAAAEFSSKQCLIDGSFGFGKKYE